MPAISKTGPSLFLGIELATDQLRASIVDESLELVGVECVDFDSELSEYKCVLSVCLSHTPTDDCMMLRLQDPRRYIHDSWRRVHHAYRDVAQGFR